jgi:hypothetical protein
MIAYPRLRSRRRRILCWSAGARNAETGLRDDMKKIYQPPTLIQYGHIADHTFTNPSGHIKGSVGTLHVDNFGETVGHNPHDSSLASS